MGLAGGWGAGRQIGAGPRRAGTPKQKPSDDAAASLGLLHQPVEPRRVLAAAQGARPLVLALALIAGSGGRRRQQRAAAVAAAAAGRHCRWASAAPGRPCCLRSAWRCGGRFCQGAGKHRVWFSQNRAWRCARSRSAAPPVDNCALGEAASGFLAPFWLCWRRRRLIRWRTAGPRIHSSAANTRATAFGGSHDGTLQGLRASQRGTMSTRDALEPAVLLGLAWCGGTSL